MFSREFLSGEGDITRHLNYMGYAVTHQQVIPAFMYSLSLSLSFFLSFSLSLSLSLSLSFFLSFSLSLSLSLSFSLSSPPRVYLKIFTAFSVCSFVLRQSSPSPSLHLIVSQLSLCFLVMFTFFTDCSGRGGLPSREPRCRSTRWSSTDVSFYSPMTCSNSLI